MSKVCGDCEHLEDRCCDADYPAWVGDGNPMVSPKDKMAEICLCFKTKETEMPDPDTRGLHDKFKVSRTDGRDAPGKKHHGCDLFVLDLTHDPDAIETVIHYAALCREKRPQLSQDIFKKYGYPG